MPKHRILELAAIGTMVYGVSYLTLVVVAGLVLQREAASFLALASMGSSYGICVALVHDFQGVALVLLAVSIMLGGAAGGLLIG